MKKRKVSAAESKLGTSVVPVGGREFQQTVSEKMGADGVIETHIGYEPTKNSGFRKTYKERSNYTVGACFRDCQNRIGQGVKCSRICRNFEHFVARKK